MSVLNYCQIQKILFYIFGKSVAKSSDIEAGCDAVFIALNKNVGIKCFHNGLVAKQTYYYSRILSTMGFTPKAWDLGSVTIYGKEIWYYFTEVADVCDSYSDNDMDDMDETDDYHYYDNDELYEEFHGHNGQMLEEINFINLDVHEKNYGYLNDQLVCIDIGHIQYNSPNGDNFCPKWA